VALYLDASVIVATLIPEAASDAIRRFLYETDEPVIVSEFAAAEVASSLSRLVRMGEMTTDIARGALGDFDAWRLAETVAIGIDDFDIAETSELVRRFELKLRAPDALHLAICLRAGATLVTKDTVLSDAARACAVSVVQP
jgi:predicted nucleic acid-binding protein